MTKDVIRVANGQGFWGDSILGPIRLVREGPLDYLTLDYLAEVTLSIMQKLRGRNPKTGEAVALSGKYVPHFKPGKDLRERVDVSRHFPIKN